MAALIQCKRSILLMISFMGNLIESSDMMVTSNEYMLTLGGLFAQRASLTVVSKPR